MTPTPPNEPELTPQVRDLLAAERDVPPLPAGFEARLWARLEHAAPPTVAPTTTWWAWTGGALMAVGAVVAIVLATSSEAPKSASVAAPAPTSEPATPEPTSALATSEPATPKPTSALATSAPPTPKPTSAPAIPAPVATSEPKPALAAPEPEPATPEVAPTPALVPAPERTPQEAAPTPEPADPVAERTLITRARVAIRDGDASAALAVLTEHMRRFPRGELAEERDALRVHAFAAAGRHSEARRARARFLSRHPQSIHAAGLEALTL